MPSPTETIGSRLRARRVELGLTLAQVAEQAGLSLPYISNLERGRGNPTLDALNARFSDWLSECYQNKPHSALPEETTPETAYRSDPRPLRWVSPEVLKDAFLHAEKRKVDKSGCVSFQGQKYEVGLAFIGCTVEIVYDPQNLSVITVEYDGHAPWTVKPLVIGTHVGKRPTLPEHLGTVPAKGSRLLDAAAKRKEARQEKQVPAVSYRTVVEEGPEDV